MRIQKDEMLRSQRLRSQYSVVMTLQFFCFVLFLTGDKSITRTEVEGGKAALPQMRGNDHVFSSWRRKTIEGSPWSG